MYSRLNFLIVILIFLPFPVLLAGKAKGDGSGKSEVEHKNGVHATEGQKDTFGINGVLEKVVQLKHDLRAEYGNAK